MIAVVLAVFAAGSRPAMTDTVRHTGARAGRSAVRSDGMSTPPRRQRARRRRRS